MWQSELSPFLDLLTITWSFLAPLLGHFISSAIPLCFLVPRILRPIPYLEFCLFISRATFRESCLSLKQISKSSDFALQCYITFQEPAYGGFLPLLFTFWYIPSDSQLFTSYFAKNSHFPLVEIRICILISQADVVFVQNGLIDIQLKSRD